MTTFNRDTILFRFVPQSKVELPRAANEAKVFVDSDGKLKILYFNGDIVELGGEQVTNVTNETIVTYDDSVLKAQLADLARSLQSFATTEELAKDIAIVLKTLDESKNETLRSYIQYVEDLNRFIAKTEAAIKASEIVAIQAKADVMSAVEQLDQLRNIVSSIGNSLSRLTGDFANSFKLFNTALNLKADKAVVAGQIAAINANIPVILAGSENVQKLIIYIP
jgi:hypothetical protein